MPRPPPAFCLESSINGLGIVQSYLAITHVHLYSTGTRGRGTNPIDQIKVKRKQFDALPPLFTYATIFVEAEPNLKTLF